MGPTSWPPGSSGSSWSLLQVDLVSIGHGRRVLFHEYRIDVWSICSSTTTQSTCNSYAREKVVILSAFGPISFEAYNFTEGQISSAEEHFVLTKKILSIT